MRLATSALLAALAAFACGNLDRDVIVAKSSADSDVANDAGAVPALEELDAAVIAQRHEPSCPRDGGCEPFRCAPYECSRYCPFGCPPAFPTSSATAPRSRSREPLP
ncbi:MAG TPA: hypothetical protein VHC69_24030 [Polyangiaceae bacterium]|nr:hypothetical protein [Polyangiaceae bacterium]